MRHLSSHRLDPLIKALAKKETGVCEDCGGEFERSVTSRIPARFCQKCRVKRARRWSSAGGTQS